MRFRRDLSALILFLLAVSLTPGGAVQASASPTFSDIEGHWAEESIRRAAQSGLVSGYPDGTFRPDQPISRGEFMKLLALLGHLKSMTPPPKPEYHWSAPYFEAAYAYKVTDGDDYTIDGRYLLDPDKPISKLEALVMTLRLLGQRPAWPPEKLSFPEALALEEPAAWLSLYREALDAGIVRGSEAGAPAEPLLRAAAVSMVTWANEGQIAGREENLLILLRTREGENRRLITTVERDGYIYVPVREVYENLDHTNTAMLPGVGWTVTPGNAAFRYRHPQVTFPFGAGTSYLRLGELMIPLVPVGGDGSLPFMQTRHDPDTRVIHLTLTEDWPGYRLPTGAAGARLRLWGGEAYGPLSCGGATSAGRITFWNDHGEELVPTVPLSVRYTVDPQSGLVLRANGMSATDLTVTMGPDYSSYPDVLLTVPDIAPGPEGAFTVTIQVDGAEPITRQHTAVDRVPHSVQIWPIPDGTVGEEQLITVRLMDSRDRVVNVNISHDRADGWFAARPWNLTDSGLTVTTPDGRKLQAKPFLKTGNLVFEHGVAHFTFTPDMPGTYHYDMLFHVIGNREFGFGASTAATVK